MCHCWVRVCGAPIHDLRNSFLVWLHARSPSISGGQNVCNIWEDAISLWSVVFILGWQILQSHACCFQGALSLSRKGTWWRITPAFPRMGDDGLQPVCSWHCLPDSLPSHCFSRLWYAIWWKRFSDYLQATDSLYKASMQAPLNSRLAYSYFAENFISLSRQRFYTSKCCRQIAYRYSQRDNTWPREAVLFSGSAQSVPVTRVNLDLRTLHLYHFFLPCSPLPHPHVTSCYTARGRCREAA